MKQTYCLEVHQIHERYSDQESLANTTRLDLFESERPFGQFQVGATITDGEALKFLGRIEHIHYWIGKTSKDEFLHTTALYIYQ